MNASYDWLRAFVDVDKTPRELRDILTEHTATVEELVPLRADLAPIVVARVAEAGRHPDSDHLWLTRVDAGAGEMLEVVCGAPNVTAGALYPFASVGTTMPNGMKIERRKIRGIYSNGMLCSAKELGLGENHDGILELTVDAKPGTPLLDVLEAGDTRMVVDVGANRPDLLSHHGLAREIAAVTESPLHLPEIPGLAPATKMPEPVEEKARVGSFEVLVDADTATRRYMLALVRGVKVGPSPEWLVRRLEAVGVRSISNVVDATNYVLHELGQPVHAFDAAKLRSPVHVRLGRANEKLTTLDGTQRVADARSVVIADASGAQAFAGIMGGRESEVTPETRDLLIEVASFDPALTRASRRRLGLNTDASYRFERGVDPEGCPAALDRVVRIIRTVAGGEVEGIADVAAPRGKSPEISVRAQRIEQVLGEHVPLQRARRYLMNAGFQLVAESDAEISVRVPSWRGDVSGEIDLVEEVARFQGYDTFPVEVRAFRPTSTYDDPLWTTSDRVRSALTALGLLEVRPMPLVGGADESHVRVRNPLSETESYLRTSLLETLAGRVAFNLSHRVGDVRIFEVGSAFAHPKSRGDLPREQARVAAVIMGRRRPPHFTEPEPPAYDEWDAKHLAEVAAAAVYPGEDIALRGDDDEPDVLWTVHVSDRLVGRVRRLHIDRPVWSSQPYGIELVIDEIDNSPSAERGANAYVGASSRPTRAAVSTYRRLPVMPPAEFDLALLVPDRLSAADVEKSIRESAGELLESLELFDQYVGDKVEGGHRSLAWRLTFRHPERTLRDKEIEGRRSRILGVLEKELNVRQRST